MAAPKRPYFNLKEIAPSKVYEGVTLDTGGPYESLYVGGGGNVRVVTLDDAHVTFTAVGTGTFMPITVQTVLTSATTATNIVGLN